ncbi:molybdopterin-dependent oxidoreductase [Lichenicoccus sp.]|uniref:molybdopterin-dependent oxidoreductase n=1 Tax=Lichenicoccus sp. TaxID=2781899 RepID=UPI003D0C76E1
MALLLGLLQAAGAGAAAADATTLQRLEIQGRVAHPQVLTVTDLKHLSPTTVTLTQVAEHGPQTATYTGVLLWTLLDRASLVDEPGQKTHLRHTILARGTDDYAVAFGLGEVDPKFEGKPVIVALARNGRPMHGLELIVPGDKHAGRDVHDLDAITVN